MSLREVLFRVFGVLFVGGIVTAMFLASGNGFYESYFETKVGSATYMNGSYVIFGAGETSREHIFSREVALYARICNISELGGIEGRDLSVIEALQPPFCPSSTKYTKVVENAIVTGFNGRDVILFIASSNTPFTLTTVPTLDVFDYVEAAGFVILWLLFVIALLYSAFKV